MIESLPRFRGRSTSLRSRGRFLFEPRYSYKMTLGKFQSRHRDVISLEFKRLGIGACLAGTRQLRGLIPAQLEHIVFWLLTFCYHFRYVDTRVFFHLSYTVIESNNTDKVRS